MMIGVKVSGDCGAYFVLCRDLLEALKIAKKERVSGRKAIILAGVDA